MFRYKCDFSGNAWQILLIIIRQSRRCWGEKSDANKESSRRWNIFYNHNVIHFMENIMLYLSEGLYIPCFCGLCCINSVNGAKCLQWKQSCQQSFILGTFSLFPEKCLHVLPVYVYITMLYTINNTKGLQRLNIQGQGNKLASSKLR